jgi:hypothetical protein
MQRWPESLESYRQADTVPQGGKPSLA